jgi:molybdate transport system regulatory protein
MRLTLRIDIDDKHQFGPGKARLLELIAEHGSITAAGRAMGMSYRRAWLLINDLNSMFADKLVEAKPGGKGGGGASLTDLGREVLVAYRRIEAHAAGAPDLIALQAHKAP